MIHSMLLVTGLMFATEATSGTGNSNDADSGDGLKAWLDFYMDEASSYKIYVEKPGTQPLELHPQALLTYTNSVRGGQQHGAIYVWTDDGRPLVAGSVWSSVPRYDQSIRSITNELVSLSVRPVLSRRERRVGRRGVVPDWEPAEPGVEFQPFSDAPEPARAAALRLVQMRRLAARFDARITRSDLEEQQRLRLQPQPLYRYTNPSAGIIDGALFSLVLATDPEAFLLLEARESDSGPRWQYALARFTDRPLSARLGDREVWSCGQAEPYVGDEPYFLYWGVATRPRSDP